MSRLILLAILGLVTWSYFPETRALLMEAAEPVALPLHRRDTQEEMIAVGRHVVDQERLTGSLPSGPDWLPWLEFRYDSPEQTRDPWGSVYQLVVWNDSIGILSLGPDRIRSTYDDFAVVAVRE